MIGTISHEKPTVFARAGSAAHLGVHSFCTTADERRYFKDPTTRVFELVLPSEHLFGDCPNYANKELNHG